MRQGIREILTSIRALLVVVFLGCGLYPACVYGLGKLLFPWQAGGSLVDRAGRPARTEDAVGSLRLGQAFTSPRYFHPRPSAAGAGYDAANSSGTNLGPLSAKLLEGLKDDPATADVDESFAGVRQLVVAYREENHLGDDVLVPADAVTRSGSGLDPHISERNAELQVARVASARGVPEARARELVRANTDGRALGVFGEPAVNVLMLNLALDRM